MSRPPLNRLEGGRIEPTDGGRVGCHWWAVDLSAIPPPLTEAEFLKWVVESSSLLTKAKFLKWAADVQGERAVDDDG